MRNENMTVFEVLQAIDENLSNGNGFGLSSLDNRGEGSFVWCDDLDSGTLLSAIDIDKDDIFFNLGRFYKDISTGMISKGIRDNLNGTYAFHKSQVILDFKEYQQMADKVFVENERMEVLDDLKIAFSNYENTVMNDEHTKRFINELELLSRRLYYTFWENDQKN